MVFGPLFESRDAPLYELNAFRPFYLHRDYKNEDKREYRFLYPGFNFYRYDFGYSWNALFLIRGSKLRLGKDEIQRRLEFWPFYFSHQVPEEEDSYRGIVPFGGGFQNRIAALSADWLLFPLYGRLYDKEKESKFFLYPVFEYTRGSNDLTGWRVWPLYGIEKEPGVSDKRFFLWPFFYNYTTQLNEKVPYVRWGAFPLISGESAEGMKSMTWLWPFMGYTFEDDPRPEYNEYRIFWPFWVYGEGEEKYISRWHPFYSVERQKKNDYVKRWYLWPLYQQVHWNNSGLRNSHYQLLYFLYQSDFVSTMDGRKSAGKRHLMPLFSYWTNGDGREQIQAFDPLSMLFPNDTALLETWLPLFAFYRMDRRPGITQHSFFWDAVFYEETKAKDTLQMGPFFESIRGEEEKKWELLKGLIGYERKEGKKRYKFLWISF